MKNERIFDIVRWGFLAAMGIAIAVLFVAIVAYSLGASVAIATIALVATIFAARRKAVVVLLLLILIVPMITACGGDVVETAPLVPTTERYGCP